MWRCHELLVWQILWVLCAWDLLRAISSFLCLSFMTYDTQAHFPVCVYVFDFYLPVLILAFVQKCNDRHSSILSICTRLPTMRSGKAANTIHLYGCISKISNNFRYIGYFSLYSEPCVWTYSVSCYLHCMHRMYCITEHSI